MPTIFGLTVAAAVIFVPLTIGFATVTLRCVVTIGGTTFAEIFTSLPDDVVMSGVCVLPMSIFTVDSAGFEMIFITCLISFEVADDISFTTIGDDLTVGFGTVFALYEDDFVTRCFMTGFCGWTFCNWIAGDCDGVTVEIDCDVALLAIDSGGGCGCDTGDCILIVFVAVVCIGWDCKIVGF